MNSTCCASSKPKIINERKRFISACVCVCERERERCACVCVREREMCVCEREREMCVCVCTQLAYMCVCMWTKRKLRKAAEVNTFNASKVFVF